MRLLCNNFNTKENNGGNGRGSHNITVVRSISAAHQHNTNKSEQEPA